MNLSDRELTFRGIVLAMILTVLLAMSNAYLALKLGILTSASIPAAIISMGVLRFFKRSTVLENNAVQTAASAGEAVAGGIVYTIPALIVIEYWNHFDYLTNFFIALSGGILGVLFSIPLRRVLVHDETLRFPEGRAIAEVLKTSSEKAGLRHIVFGGGLGALLELLQSGLKVISSSVSHWVVVKKTLFGFGLGFSSTMIGAGYLVGFDMALSIFLGAAFAWGLLVPLASHVYPAFLSQQTPSDALMGLWNTQLRYVGIGAMLFAGIWTFIKLSKPLMKRIMVSFDALLKPSIRRPSVDRTDRDLPIPFIVGGILLVAVGLFLFFNHVFPTDVLGLPGNHALTVTVGAVLYVLVVGFLFSVITAYFSGMVGVTASPGSSVVIAGILFAAWLLLCLVHAVLPLPFNAEQLKAAEAITIIIGSIVTGIAAIANDNTQ
ncbi:MAG: OPT family oligopeptide transporter, partial [Legionellaceae bacterium]